MRELLAKSPRGQRKLPLFQHLWETERAAAALFRTGTRWADAFLRFFGLPAAELDRFLLNLRVAALFHDVGKANSGFLDAIHSVAYHPQPYRHEHLSALLLVSRAVRSWLASCPSLDVDTITAAVLCHHLKASESGEHQVLFTSHPVAVTLYLEESDIQRTFAHLATLLDLPPFTATLPTRFSNSSSEGAAASSLLYDDADAFRKAIKRDGKRRAFSLALKAALIAADSVASATFREQLPIETWIDEVAHQPPLADADIERDILARRKDELAARTGATFSYHAFQDGAATLGRRAVLLAGCGAGKTLAAWRWAKQISTTNALGRVIFLYPTRGTATEGFRDYVGHAPEQLAALVHGTSRYELESMAANPTELPPALRDKHLQQSESEARLFALGLWPKRYFSATVDQFLSFLENGYRGLCLLPALADSAIILDEVHSYDASMWRALMTLLRHFDVPVLCMTASLPPGRLSELQGAGLEVYPRSEHQHELQDLAEAEGLPRYQLRPVTDEAAALETVAHEQATQRVLWVVNTVARCQDLAQRLEARLGRKVLVYHSRFTLQDRQRRHRDTVDAFSPRAGEPAIAVTTQVCEMSLDLDADILVTEHAPVSSLVQRLGRAHRHTRQGRRPAPIITYPPSSPAPYERKELESAALFIEALGRSPTSQRRLAEELHRFAASEPLAADWTAFTCSDYFAVPGSLREEDGSFVPAILADRIDEYLALHKAGKATDGLQLNVPRKSARRHEDARLPKWLWIATGTYDPHLGYLAQSPSPLESP